MPIIGLQQVAATVSDLNRSIEFYTEVLGLDYLGTKWMSADQVYEIFGLQGVAVQYGWFRAGSCMILELLEFDPPNAAPLEYAPNRAGLQHFAFQVTDLDNLFADLQKAGVETVSAPRAMQGGYRSAYIKDPDGLLIELIDMRATLISKIKILGPVLGFWDKMRRRRAESIATGACRSGKD